MRRRRYDLGMYGLAIEWSASVLGLTLLGLWIDRRWQTEPWGLVTCVSIGCVGGTYNFIRSARRVARQVEQRAAERAVERAAERAVERAVERAAGDESGDRNGEGSG